MQLASLREESLRERAELENQRRRMAREIEMARRFANERLPASFCRCSTACMPASRPQVRSRIR
jgi:molecular chaperone GrpE (heat shock protein)